MITFGTKAGITPFQFIKTVVILLLGSCALLACKTQPEAPSSPALLTNAEQVAIYDSSLFRAEDLGWPVDSYDQGHYSIDPPDHVPIYSVDAGATARSNPINPKTGVRYRDDILGATQTLWVFADEEEASELFEEYIKSYGLSSGAYEPESVHIEPKVDDILWGCWGMGDSNLKNSHIKIQHGRYVTTGNMIVDGEIIAFADLEVFINVIQDRLLVQVATEP